MPKSGRGVLYVVWGSKIEPVLQRSLASLKATHPELPVEIVRTSGAENEPRSLLEKSRMFDLSPFEETLYLDADTVIVERLDFAFEKAHEFSIACCICEAPWARRYAGLSNRGDMIEYNTGVLFFTERAKPVFDLWRDAAPDIDSSIRFYLNGRLSLMQYNDQASFALAVERAQISPFVLPRNWNFRADIERAFVGPIKIWHSHNEIPPALREVNDYYRRPNSIIQKHYYQLPGDIG